MRFSYIILDVGIKYEVEVAPWSKKPNHSVEIWRLNGVIHREDDLPAIVVRSSDNQVVHQEWVKEGNQYRKNGPAHLFDDGVDTYEKWVPSNRNGPTISKTKNGVVFYEEWHNESGIWHRIDAPAIIERDLQTGHVIHEEWIYNGKPHRVDGAAEIFYDANSGLITGKLYYKNGRNISMQQLQRFKISP